ncbi:MAG: PBP1A family penicillin-binding protein [Aerococcaceae bacterium]|nr:PBP1A family penicillin-binding protein [Aerococcaceae bacterium]
MVTGSRVERQKYAQSSKKSPTPNKRKKHPRKRRKSWLKRLFVWSILLVFLMMMAGAALFGYYAMNAPTISKQDLVGQVSSKIYDREGNLIKELGTQNRDLMTADEIPEVLKQAVLAIEDARFYEHNGIDPIRIGGALVANLKSGKVSQGGSTITQQLVKLSVFSTDFKDQTIERKAQEAWLALQLEQQYSKDDILTFYLNKLFYSNNVYGAKTATRTFFNKDLSELTLAEAALLAGLPQAPSDYDPYRFPAEAKERRDLVLKVMLDRGLVSKEDYQTAVDTPIASMLVPLSDGALSKRDLVIDAYLDVVHQEVKTKLNLDIFTDGIEVYTNLDMNAQEYAYKTVNENTAIPFPDDNIQTALAIIDVTNGELQAVIGGRKQNVSLGLNRANTLNRSIGSTMKPLADYGPAFEYLNYSTGTLVVDEPYRYSSGDDLQNYDFEYKGNQTVREALAGSRNIPALKLLQEVGLDNSYAFLQKMDIHIKNDERNALVEANAIGGEVTPIQLTAAYATIANYGVYHEPFAVKKVVTSGGTTHEFQSQPRQAMKDSTAYMLVDILKGVPGTFAPGAEIPGIYHAGKTGTTNYTADQIAQLGLDPSTYAAPDGWFAGITPQYAIATWVGYDNPFQPGNYLTLEETRLPQLIYADIMQHLMSRVPVTDWTMPNSLSRVEIEKYTNPILLPGDYTPIEARSIELFLKGKEPTIRSTNFGRYIAPPTNFDVNYDQATKTIKVTWDAMPAGTTGQFELMLNGEVIYVGPNNTFDVPAADPKDYEFRLRIIDGNSSSDVLVFTLSLKVETSSESSSSVESSSESSSESTSTPPADSVTDPASSAVDPAADPAATTPPATPPADSSSSNP